MIECADGQKKHLMLNQIICFVVLANTSTNGWQFSFLVQSMMLAGKGPLLLRNSLRLAAPSAHGKDFLLHSVS